VVKEICFGKNVSLKIKNIEIVQGFMHKTRRNFSQTVNIIIEQWDGYSLAMQKIQEDLSVQQKLDEIKKAEVIDPVKEKAAHAKKKPIKKVRK